MGHSFNGFVLTEEEYLRIEDAYIAAATRFAVDVSASVFRVVYVGHQSGQYALVAGQTVIRSDLGPLVRGNLRGDLDCAIESTEGLYQLAFGYDLYMYLAAATPCEQAVGDSIRQGLWVEPSVPLALWGSEDE